MDEWLEEDLSLLAGGEQLPRVLDQRMIREPIRYLAPRPPVCVAPTDTVIDTIRMMREHRIGCVLVIERERLLGIVTERDFIMKLGQGDGERPVGVVSVKDIVDYIADFFPNDVLTVPPDPARGERWRGRDGG